MSSIPVAPNLHLIEPGEGSPVWYLPGVSESTEAAALELLEDNFIPAKLGQAGLWAKVRSEKREYGSSVTLACLETFEQTLEIIREKQSDVSDEVISAARQVVQKIMSASDLESVNLTESGAREIFFTFLREEEIEPEPAGLDDINAQYVREKLKLVEAACESQNFKDLLSKYGDVFRKAVDKYLLESAALHKVCAFFEKQGGVDLAQLITENDPEKTKSVLEKVRVSDAEGFNEVERGYLGFIFQELRQRANQS